MHGQSRSDRIFQWLFNFFSLDKKLRLVPIAFNRAWWQIILQQKWLFTIVVFNELLQQVFISLVPLAMGQVIQQQSYFFAGMLFFIWAALLGFENIAFSAGTEFELRCIYSVYYQAHQRLLRADPLAHTLKSSGAIIAKIERASSAFEESLDILCFEIIPTIFRSITIIITLSAFNLKLGFWMGIALAAYTLITTYAYLKTIDLVAPRKFKALDASRAIGAENLAQHIFIRSCFAADEINARLKKTIETAMYIEGTGWRTYQTVRNIMSYGYVSIVAALALYLLAECRDGNLSVLIATTLLLSFITSTVDVAKICRRVYNFMKNARAIEDLYGFIESFAQQSFPVLLEEKKTDIAINHSVIDINIRNLHFEYPGQAPLFDGHSFALRIPTDAPNKLFGIIGPSGVGKTTLISLLGGQLKPNEGSININGINIYEVIDAQRRELLGVQQQSATSMRGDVRGNLIFGLPTNYRVSDEELIVLLKNVGLWNIFEYKDGLDTFVGESGLNLSGGQRQRMNFANLYLRAHHYQPLVILIDEPTSSLDKLSEQAITAMIHELTLKSVVFVIAHRIETLQHAAACIDLSLINEDKKLVLYTFEELKERSAYFNKLMEHQEQLAYEG